MNIDDFEIPDDEQDYPITSAEEILEQTRRVQSGGECVVYSLYPMPRLCSNVDAAQDLMCQVEAEAAAMLQGYIWSREKFNLHIVEFSGTLPVANNASCSTEKLYFLQGSMIYGDCIDDEWFVVHVLMKISEAFPELCVQIIDRDGELLLIEAADVIPRWLKPENAQNRVWVKAGKVLLLPGQVLSGEVGSIKITEACSILGESDCSLYVNEAVSSCIQQRISVFPIQHLAGRHIADVIMPRRCAAVLLMHPHLISTAVNTLCDGNECLKKDVSSLDCIGAADFISIPVIFTRIQYAQLMFQNFEPPALLRLAEKRFDFKDKKAIKALDIGMRLVCGVEGAVKKARKLRSDIRHWNQNHVEKQSLFDDNTREECLSEYLEGTEVRFYSDVESAVDAAFSADNASYCDFPAIVAQGPSFKDWKGESDAWLYLTPEAMDKEMSERVKTMKGTGLQNITEKNSEASISHASNPVKNGGDVESLTGVVKGLETFLAGESGFDGVEPEGDRESDYFSDESDGESTGTEDSGEGKYNNSSRWGAMSSAEDHGDIILNMDKLLFILEDYQSNATSRKKKMEKSLKRKAAAPGSIQKNDDSVGIADAPMVTGTATYTLDDTVTAASGACVLEDSSDSDDYSRDSDDVGSHDEEAISSAGSDESVDVGDEEFYKEYDEAMQGELSRTTLGESFLRHKDSNIIAKVTGDDNGALKQTGSSSDKAFSTGESDEVDEELNMLTHLLESHASQAGMSGPVGNLLNSLGVAIPSTGLSTADDQVEGNNN